MVPVQLLIMIICVASYFILGKLAGFTNQRLISLAAAQMPKAFGTKDRYGTVRERTDLLRPSKRGKYLGPYIT